jgi:hypothetical protein
MVDQLAKHVSSCLDTLCTGESSFLRRSGRAAAYYCTVLGLIQYYLVSAMTFPVNQILGGCPSAGRLALLEKTVFWMGVDHQTPTMMMLADKAPLALPPPPHYNRLFRINYCSRGDQRTNKINRRGLTSD